MSFVLHVSALSVSVEKKDILHNVDLAVEAGTVNALMGPNGSGKSTLVYAVAGHPRYKVTNGSIILNGKDIIHKSPDERTREGLFVAFQQVPSISGLSVRSFLKETYQVITGSSVDSLTFNEIVDEKRALLKIDPALLERSLYEGFSGGEKKRLELLQLLLFNPKVAILDEIDSGVDVDSLSYIINGLKDARSTNPAMSIIFITHYHHILDHIKPDYVHVLQHGKIAQSGGFLLEKHIHQYGYQNLNV